MPGSLNSAVSIGTLPHSVSTKFTEAHGIPMNINRYRDNSSQRTSLATGVRKSWKIAKRLDPVNLALLRDFFYNARGGAFYFYNPAETNPPFTNNPTGTAGRYLVRFNNDWLQTNDLGRISTAIELVEVLPQGSEAIPVVTIGGGGLPSGGGTGGGGGVPLRRTTSINPAIAGGEWLRYSSQGTVGYGPVPYGGYLWTYGAASEFDGVQDGVFFDVVTGAGMYKSADGVTWRKVGGDVWFGDFPNAAYYDQNTATVTFLIGGYDRGSGDPSINPAKLVDFSLASGSYGTPTATVQLAPKPDLLNPFTQLFKRSDGTFRVLYSGGTGLYFVDYSGSSWSSPTTIVSGGGFSYAPFTSVQDGDTLHVIYGVEHVSGFSTLQDGFQYVQIAADGTMSAPVSVSAMDTSSFVWAIQNGIMSGETILFPVWKRHSDITYEVGVLVGTPKDNPTFTYVMVGSVPNNSIGDDMKIYRLGSTDYFGWTQFNPNTSDDNMSQIYIAKSTDHGATWTAPRTLIDLDAHPVPADADGYYDQGPIPDGADGYTRDIFNFSFGTQLDGTLGLMYTSWATYYTNDFTIP